jgi:hypothetical protein
VRRSVTRCKRDALHGALTPLLLDTWQVPDELRDALASSGVSLAPYEEVEAAVRATVADGTRILLDPKLLNYGT